MAKEIPGHSRQETNMVLGSQHPDKGGHLHSLDSKSRGVSKIKVGSPDMENQTRKTLKTPRLYKKDAKAAEKSNARVQAGKTDSHLKGNMIIWQHTYGTKKKLQHEQTSI